jgi:hypothetical protein
MRTSSLAFTRIAGLTVALGASLAVGCAADSAQPSEAFEVSSDVRQGLLARVSYEEGGHVDFLRVDEGGVFIAGVFEKDGENPLHGIRLSKVLPSELFAYLTGREAPVAIIDAERDAGLVSNPDAFASVESESQGDLGMTAQALTGENFHGDYCYPGIDLCYLGYQGNLKEKGDGRIDSIDGHVNVTAGSMRLRIIRERKIGGDQVLARYFMAADGSDAVVQIGGSAPGLDRKMWIQVDQADTAVYHLAAEFDD